MINEFNFFERQIETIFDSQKPPIGNYLKGIDVSEYQGIINWRKVKSNQKIDSLSFANAPTDDRNLPDLHFALYKTVVVFDHVAKVVHVIHNAIDLEGENEFAWD